MITRGAARAACCGLFALVGLAACGDSTDIGDGLTQTQATQLLTALSGIYLPSPSAPSPTAAPASGLALVPTTTLRVDTTDVAVSCPAGGNAVVATIDSLSTTSDVRLNPSQDTSYVSEASFGGHTESNVVYDGCVGTDGNGGSWTFDSADGLTLDFTIDGTYFTAALTEGGTISETNMNWAGVWSGTLDWSGSEGSGQCTISIDMSSSSTSSGSQVTSTFSQSGQICGVDVSNSSSF